MPSPNLLTDYFIAIVNDIKSPYFRVKQDKFRLFINMQRRLNLIFFVITVSFSLPAQDFRNGYIIKMSGDSLSGLVEYPVSNSRASTCTFKVNKKSRVERFGPNDLKAYGIFDDRRYESLKLSIEGNEESVFAEVLLKGAASLYMRKGVFYLLKDSLIRLPPPNDKMVEVESKKYVGSDKKYVTILNQLFEECNLTANETKYLQKDLTNLIQNYNRCQGSVGIIYKQELPWIKLHYQIGTGFTNSTFQMERSDESTFSSNNSLFVGGTVEIGSPRIYDKLLFSIESFYAKHNYQGYLEVPTQGGNLRSDVFLSTSFIKMPLGFRFNLLHEFSSPYIKGGILFARNFNSTVKIIDELESNGVVTTMVSEDKLDSSGHNGFWAAVGFHRVISSRYKAFLELRYEKVNSDVDYFLRTPTTTDNYNVLLGIRF